MDQSTPHGIDVEAIRAAARNLEDGPVTAGYQGDRQGVIQMLNAALATELVCILRYKRHYFTAEGQNATAVAAEFLQHATEEQGHADQIASRITQLQGEPDFNPATLLSRSHAEYDASINLQDMLREDLVAERVAIASYSEMIRWLDEGDPTTRNMLEGILAVEEEHADDLLKLLHSFD
jgi:bacterioferritin